MNLIINAAESINDNNGTVKVALTKVAVLAGQADKDFLGIAIPAGIYACLEVSDTGCGMDEETQKRIFEPFFTTKFTGRGLGMSAILGIIKSHNGALQLSSKLGSGSTFRVFFPLNDLQDYSEATQTAGVGLTAKTSVTILLVDDEIELLTIGTAMLTSMGFTSTAASNGREALRIYRERGSVIDLIFMDLIMPEMGGIEIYNELRKIVPTIPIIFCSGYDKDEISSTINDDKNVGFVQKSYMPDQLRNELVKFLHPTVSQNQ